MIRAGFYSRGRQFFREWRALWRMHGLDTILGGLFVIGGFYIAHRVGISQVYDVINPFIIASFVAGYLTWIIGIPQSRGATLPFYFNLPRDRTAAWDAHLAYVVCAVLWMEAIILIGVALKIGSANITPHYRLHPEAFGLPFLTVAAVSCYAHVQHSRQNFVIALLAVVAFITALYYWLLYGFPENPERHNNYYPSRGFALTNQYTFAAILLLATAFVLAQCRAHWRRREVGEIQ